jgi:hypothetical protein
MPLRSAFGVVLSTYNFWPPLVARAVAARQPASI